VLAGPERKARIPDEEANTITAYHEGGHAIVAYYTKDSHPLHKVTIIPRGPSLGHVSNSLIRSLGILVGSVAVSVSVFSKLRSHRLPTIVSRESVEWVTCFYPEIYKWTKLSEHALAAVMSCLG